MSRILKWRPANSGASLPDDLKFKLRELYGEPVSYPLDAAELSTLRALAACGVDGAKTLIAAIEKYGDVFVFEV